MFESIDKLGLGLFSGILFGFFLQKARVMAVFGLCPGTSVAACGEGRRDAITGVLGMLFGAGMYVWFYPGLQTFTQAMGSLGKVTLPQATGTSPWLWIGLLAGLLVAVFGWVELHARNRRAQAGGAD
jgi:uncharacterized protein